MITWILPDEESSEEEDEKFFNPSHDPEKNAGYSEFCVGIVIVIVIIILIRLM